MRLQQQENYTTKLEKDILNELSTVGELMGQKYTNSGLMQKLRKLTGKIARLNKKKICDWIKPHYCCDGNKLCQRRIMKRKQTN